MCVYVCMVYGMPTDRTCLRLRYALGAEGLIRGLNGEPNTVMVGTASRAGVRWQYLVAGAIFREVSESGD